MSTYLLLRDNKENGPLTFEEIKAKGLKAYDLVWVEGKSAAWRYPGEIEELKPFSPEVVEQPFDRFFKKPSQVHTAVQDNTSIKEPVLRESAAETDSRYQPIPAPGRRNVYVTLPIASKQVAQPAVNVSLENRIKEPPTSIPVAVDEESYSMGTSPASQEKRTSFQTYKTLNETFEPAIKKQFTQRRDFKKPAIISGAILLLLGTGILIGILIEEPHTVVPTNLLQDQRLAAPPVVTIRQDSLKTTGTSASSDQPNAGDQVSVVAKRDVARLNTPERVTARKTMDNQLLVTSPQKTQKNTPLKAEGQLKADTSAVSTSTAMIPVQHREATHRDDASPNRPVNVAPLNSMVSASSNKYTVGPFGGISDLQLTVNNRSTHALGMVVMEVQYIQANKKVFKTENIYFKNINAGGALMQEAPKSSRGIKVQYRITRIDSRESDLSTTGIQ